VKKITFFVPDEVAAEMHHRSVYLDVFGYVRWRNDDAPVVEGASRWETWAARPWGEPEQEPGGSRCNGSSTCSASFHVHGCFNDREPGHCDAPGIHEAEQEPGGSQP
jgi:hypothetical protein